MTKWPERKIIVDSRELRPWQWPRDRVIRRSLGTGGADYSLEGCETIIRLERKSLDDLVNSLSDRRPDGPDARSNRARLKAELAWLAENVRWRFLLFEGSWEDISERRYRSRMHPTAIAGSLASWSLRYGIHVVAAGSRNLAFGLANRVFLRVEAILEEEEQARCEPCS